MGTGKNREMLDDESVMRVSVRIPVSEKQVMAYKQIKSLLTYRSIEI
jgi:hypothetical protein